MRHLCQTARFNLFMFPVGGNADGLIISSREKFLPTEPSSSVLFSVVLFLMGAPLHRHENGGHLLNESVVAGLCIGCGILFVFVFVFQVGDAPKIHQPQDEQGVPAHPPPEEAEGNRVSESGLRLIPSHPIPKSMPFTLTFGEPGLLQSDFDLDTWD